ncbi:Transcription factor GAGA [Anthophora quadrimaculata]
MSLDLTELILGDGLSRARSMSDQPTSCPLCGAILRQSRNLRRHLELLHFGHGSNNKSGVHMRHRRTNRNNDLVRSTLASICQPHMTKTDHSRALGSTDFSALTSLSITSTVSSSASNVSLAGSLMGPSVLGTGDQSTNSALVAASSSCTASANNGTYSSDGSASMLSCLLPSLPSLPSLSSSHDMFRHGEILRAGIAYHDSSRQHNKQSQRTDVI